MKDRTALGVHSLLIQSTTGLWPNIKLESDEVYTPIMNAKEVDKKTNRWNTALEKAGVI
jgi:glycerol kinase